MSSKSLAAAAAVAMLSACTVHAPLAPLPDVPSGAVITDPDKADVTGQWPRQRWWESLGDPQLASLVEEGLANNPDMDAAMARIEATRAAAMLAGARQSPSVDVNASMQRSQLSENGLFPPPLGGSSLWQNKASLDFRWELDFWGRQRSELRAGLREEQAVRLESELTALALSTSIVRRYIEWQRVEEQLAIARSLLADREAMLSLTRRRVQAGIDSDLQLSSAEAGVPQARADVTALENQAELLRIEIATLVGAGPDRARELERPIITAPALKGAPAWLPADLMARRADVTARRLRAEAAAARADAAQADFYPNINLAAAAGLDSISFDDWINAGSRFYNAGPALNLPLFGGGTRRANLRMRTAQYDEAVAAYRQALLGALREVVSTLAELRSIDREQSDAEAAVAGQARALALTRKRYEAGIGNHIEVLVAEQQWLNERRRLVDLNARRLDASVRLVSALGGGIDPAGILGAQR